MERPIGDIFEYNDGDKTVKLQVVESTGFNCDDCYFKQGDFKKCTTKNDEITGYCTRFERNLNRNEIIFKEIK